jgi:hypothetical protein
VSDMEREEVLTASTSKQGSGASSDGGEDKAASLGSD